MMEKEPQQKKNGIRKNGWQNTTTTPIILVQNSPTHLVFYLFRDDLIRTGAY